MPPWMETRRGVALGPVLSAAPAPLTPCVPRSLASRAGTCGSSLVPLRPARPGFTLTRDRPASLTALHAAPHVSPQSRGRVLVPGEGMDRPVPIASRGRILHALVLSDTLTLPRDKRGGQSWHLPAPRPRLLWPSAPGRAPAWRTLAPPAPPRPLRGPSWPRAASVSSFESVGKRDSPAARRGG